MRTPSEYFGDRIKETTTTTGTGAIALGGAVASFQTFNNGLKVVADGVTKTTYYAVFSSGGSEWEVGIGTISAASSTTLNRTTVLSSSNSNQAVNFSAGTKTVVATAPEAFISCARSEKDILVTAGETLTLNDCIYIDRNDGKAYKSVASIVADGPKSFMFGFATEAASTNATVRMRIIGKLSGFTGLQRGRYQYMSNTAGLITETAPFNAIPVAIATSINEIYISSQTYQRRDFVFGYNVYMMGGYTASGTRTNRCDRISTVTDTTSANLILSTSYLGIGDQCSLSNFNNKGYTLGGISIGIVSSGYILNFAEDTVAAITTTNLSGVRQEATGVSERNNKGYAVGGVSAAATAVTTTDLLRYNTDVTTATTTANASQARAAGAGVTEGYFKGYVLGGYSGGGLKVVTSDLITFANDVTVARTSVDLPAAGSHLLYSSSPAIAGYTYGGQTGVALPITTIRKITFATDAISNLSAVLTAARYGASGGGNGYIAAYICGGHTSSTVFISASNKFTYSNETITSVTGLALSQGRARGGNLSDVAC